MQEQLKAIIDFYAANINSLTSVEFYAFNKQVMRLARKASGMDNLEVTGFQPEQNFLNEYLGSVSTPVVLDVGAYRGDYAAGALKANANSKVFSFEPHPVSYQKLKKRSRDLGFVAVNIGCSDRDGTLKLFDIAEESRSFRTTAYQEAIEKMLDRKSVCYEVPTTSLDSFCRQADISHIDLLKIDAEGHEINILEGASTLLKDKKVHAIQFEFNELSIYAGKHFKDFVDQLPDYMFFILLPDGAVPLGAYNPLEHENYVYQNIVAFPKWGRVIQAQ